MILKDVCVITDGQNYFRKGVISSTSGNYVAIFAPLTSRTKTYKDKRKIAGALRWVKEHYESPYVKSEYIEYAEVPDEPEEPKKAKASDEPCLEKLEIVPKDDYNGWIAMDKLCEKLPKILKKGTRYAIILTDNVMYYLPNDERLAWQRYFRECEKFVFERIEKRIKNNLSN